MRLAEQGPADEIVTSGRRSSGSPSTAPRPAGANAAGTSTSGLSSWPWPLVSRRPETAQAQPLGDGENDVEAHRRFAEAAEDDLGGRPVQELELDRLLDFLGVRLGDQSRFAVDPVAEARRQKSQAQEQRLVMLR